MISGVVTNGQIGGVDVTGQQAFTAVVDNGRSANDPSDQLSFSFVGFTPPGFCTALVPADLPLFNLTHGQVTVR